MLPVKKRAKKEPAPPSPLKIMKEESASLSDSTGEAEPQVGAVFSFKQLKDELIRPQQSKTGVKYTVSDLAEWVTISARREYSIKRLPEELAVTSPERLELFREFERIDLHFAGEESGVVRRMQNAASKRYVECKLGLDQVPGQFDHAGRNIEFRGSSPDTPIPKRVLKFDKGDGVPSTPRKKNINWKNAPQQCFNSISEAKQYLENNHEKLSPTRSTKSKNKSLKISWYACGSNCCRARIECENNSESVILKVHSSPVCSEAVADVRPKKRLPEGHKCLVQKIIDDEPFLEPAHITNKALLQIASNTNESSTSEEMQALRGKLYNHTRTLIRNSRRLGEDGPFITLATIAEFKLFKKKFGLHLPSSFASISGRKNLQKLARLLYQQDHLNVIPTQVVEDNMCVLDQAHNLMTVLDNKKENFQLSSEIIRPDISEAEKRLMVRIQQLEREAQTSGSKMEQVHPWECTIVFSSLSLLATILEAKQMDFKVMFSVDGTFNISTNNYVLVTFGCNTMNKDGTRSFRLLFMSWIPREAEVYFAISMITFLRYIRLLFGVCDPNLCAVCSDHSLPFVNVITIAFPNSTPVQCFTHISRKFRSGRSNGAYKSHTKASGFLKNTAIVDVQFLHRCQTKEMFLFYAELSRQGWISEGEKKLWNVFSNSYLNPKCFQNWFRGALHLLPADNQPVESFNSRLKGTKTSQGLIKTNRPPGWMLQKELPKAIHLLSVTDVGVTECFPIDSREHMLHPTSKRFFELIHFCGMSNRAIDVYEDSSCKGVFYVNRLEEIEAMDSVGHAITEHRLEQYHNAISGRGEFKSSERNKFRHIVDSLCRVVVQEDTAGNLLYRGNCPCFSRYRYCVHAAYLKWGEELSVDGYKIPEYKSARLRSGGYSAKDQLFMMLEKIHAIRMQVLNCLLDDRYQIPATERIRSDVLDLPDSHVWSQGVRQNNSKVYFASKLRQAMTSWTNFINLFNSLMKFRKGHASEQEVLGYINLIHCDMEIITKGRNTHVTERPKRDPLSPELLRR